MNRVDFIHCYGCGICAISCPLNAIHIKYNEDGFLYPHVDSSCVNCGICLNVCAFNFTKHLEAADLIPLVSMAAWSYDKAVRTKCTSGGVSYEIGRFLIRKGYSVIACRYNPLSKKAEHYLATDEDTLKDSIGSKYIQSYTLPGFSQIIKGCKYLITGTPCQIDSMRRYVRKKGIESDVILLDFFCHGVPSMLMWKQYLKELENHIGHFDKIVWRDKETGWHDSWVMKVDQKYSSWFSKGDLFFKMFLKDRCLGKACYENCKYKYDNSAADIRIGDLWGTTYQNDEDGVNGVICFTHKGVELLKEMEPILHIEESTLDVVTESQMKKCPRRPISYKYVMNQLKKGTYLCHINKVASLIELVEQIPQKIKYYIKRIPSKLKEIIRYEN